MNFAILKRKVMVPNDGQCLRVCAGYKAIIISSRARGSLKLSNISWSPTLIRCKRWSGTQGEYGDTWWWHRWWFRPAAVQSKNHSKGEESNRVTSPTPHSGVKQGYQLQHPSLHVLQLYHLTQMFVYLIIIFNHLWSNAKVKKTELTPLCIIPLWCTNAPLPDDCFWTSRLLNITIRIGTSREPEY